VFPAAGATTQLQAHLGLRQHLPRGRHLPLPERLELRHPRAALARIAERALGAVRAVGRIPVERAHVAGLVRAHEHDGGELRVAVAGADEVGVAGRDGRGLGERRLADLAAAEVARLHRPEVEDRAVVVGDGVDEELAMVEEHVPVVARELQVGIVAKAVLEAERRGFVVVVVAAVAQQAGGQEAFTQVGGPGILGRRGGPFWPHGAGDGGDHRRGDDRLQPCAGRGVDGHGVRHRCWCHRFAEARPEDGDRHRRDGESRCRRQAGPGSESTAPQQRCGEHAPAFATAELVVEPLAQQRVGAAQLRTDRRRRTAEPARDRRHVEVLFVAQHDHGSVWLFEGEGRRDHALAHLHAPEARFG
jgi:hypothetical protein